MSSTARIPVVVGAAAVAQRCEDAREAAEPFALMARAVEAAAGDAGAPELLARADLVAAPRGFWDYADPARLVADRVGASRARTELAEIGVLQTTLLGRGASAIARGEAEVVIVTGGEARHREQQARRQGVEAPLMRQPEDTIPDVVLRPEEVILSEREVRTALAVPVRQYAMIENALRAADGQSLAEHATEVARLWAGMSEVAADNPDAWSRERVAAAAVATTGPDNRLLALPYAKRHTSQWNVDQAAGLVITSTEVADALGIPAARRVHPWSIADANHMVPLTEREALHRSPGFALAGAAVFEGTGLAPGDVRHLELYSCFPAAVRVQLRELGLAADRRLTVTGGMAWAGGPLNNFVLQALARMVRVLRADPGSHGLVTAISGMITKQGVSLWSTVPPPRPFRFDDVSEAVARESRPVPMVDEAKGPATVVSYTVVPEADGWRTAALCALPDGSRVIASSDDAELARRAMEIELCGRAVRLAAPDRLEAIE